MLSSLDHVGVVVKNIQEALDLYGNMLGLTPWNRGILENRKTGQRMVITRPRGGTFLEFIQPPTRAESRHSRYMQEHGEGLFHLCFFSDDFDADVKALKRKGFALEEETVSIFPGVQFRIVWIPPQSTRGVWIEIADKAAIPDFLVNHDF
jgi:methylmalonyl-CoA/ethylmalonyl-CoA epimerase